MEVSPACAIRWAQGSARAPLRAFPTKARSNGGRRRPAFGTRPAPSGMRGAASESVQIFSVVASLRREIPPWSPQAKVKRRITQTKREVKAIFITVTNSKFRKGNELSQRNTHHVVSANSDATRIDGFKMCYSHLNLLSAPSTFVISLMKERGPPVTVWSGGAAQDRRGSYSISTGSIAWRGDRQSGRPEPWMP